MELQLLGPVQAAADGRQVNLGVRMQRFVLAVLALEANQLVTTERLIDLAWPEDPPRTARRIIQTQISRLRGTLAAAGVDEVFSVCPAGPGYRLRCEPDCVDAHRFTSLLGRAGGAADDEVRIGLLSEALALWQGPALADTVTEATRALLCGHLDEARLTAMADRLDALLRQGDQQTVIHEAGGLAVRHPDRFTGHIMLALHHAGRTAEALAAYRQAKQRLEDEFGLDPPATLRRLELRILRDRPDLNPPQKRRQSAIRLCRPAQLPADLPMFTGRAGELARLNAWLAHNGCVPTAAVICAINGMPGVGKTALAVHWAHLVAGRFPDGTLYVNLRGVDPSKPAMSPAEAVRGFLDAFEVPPHRIPADPDSQVGMYRSLLAGRRVLVVLDNAHDTEQVRPLLPGSPTCLTVVTSRNQLTGLAAAQSAKILALDPLTEDHARELLTDRIGPQRVAAEPDAVSDIITRCAGLPLALAIVAARAALHPHFPLAALVAGLAHSQLNDPDSDIRHFFSWSYRSLTPPAARLFRLLGLHPGPDTSPSAAASLVAVPVGEILPLLAELTRNNLLIEHVPGRFTFHDLLRDYACHLAQDFEPEVPRHAATHRLLDHYLHTAHAAAVLLNPHLEPVALMPPQPSVTPETLTSYEQAQVNIK